MGWGRGAVVLGEMAVARVSRPDREGQPARARGDWDAPLPPAAQWPSPTPKGRSSGYADTRTPWAPSSPGSTRALGDVRDKMGTIKEGSVRFYNRYLSTSSSLQIHK